MFWGDDYARPVTLTLQQKRRGVILGNKNTHVRHSTTRGVSSELTAMSRDTPPLLRFSVASGAPLRSRCQWCRMVVRRHTSAFSAAGFLGHSAAVGSAKSGVNLGSPQNNHVAFSGSPASSYVLGPKNGHTAGGGSYEDSGAEDQHNSNNNKNNNKKKKKNKKKNEVTGLSVATSSPVSSAASCRALTPPRHTSPLPVAHPDTVGTHSKGGLLAPLSHYLFSTPHNTSSHIPSLSKGVRFFSAERVERVYLSLDGRYALHCFAHKYDTTPLFSLRVADCVSVSIDLAGPHILNRHNNQYFSLNSDVADNPHLKNHSNGSEQSGFFARYCHWDAYARLNRKLYSLLLSNSVAGQGRSASSGSKGNLSSGYMEDICNVKLLTTAGDEIFMR